MAAESIYEALTAENNEDIEDTGLDVSSFGKSLSFNMHSFTANRLTHPSLIVGGIFTDFAENDQKWPIFKINS